MALVAIIASVCFISFCYRNIYHNRFCTCGKVRDPTVEVIIETQAVIEMVNNYTDADAYLDDIMYSQSDLTESQKCKELKTKDCPVVAQVL